MVPALRRRRYRVPPTPVAANKALLARPTDHVLFYASRELVVPRGG